MNVPKNVLTTATAAVIYSACATLGGPAPTRPLAYEVPSPPMATYRITDTTAITVSTPQGDLVINTGSAVTLAMTFKPAPEGVRVTGIVESLDASITNPMAGTESVDADDVSGSLEYVIGRRGDVEIASLPEVSGPLQLSPFASIARQLFPPLPDAVVEPGGMWVDTVTWTTEAESLETASTAVLTYTLVGDTLVEGRTLLNFAMSGELSIEVLTNQGGMAIKQSMADPRAGFIFWDSESGLPVYQEAERDMEGTTSVAGMPPFSMSVVGTTNVRLVN